jgi:hypothetical protein
VALIAVVVYSGDNPFITLAVTAPRRKNGIETVKRGMEAVHICMGDIAVTGIAVPF